MVFRDFWEICDRYIFSRIFPICAVLLRNFCEIFVEVAISYRAREFSGGGGARAAPPRASILSIKYVNCEVVGEGMPDTVGTQTR